VLAKVIDSPVIAALKPLPLNRPAGGMHTLRSAGLRRQAPPGFWNRARVAGNSFQLQGDGILGQTDASLR